MSSSNQAADVTISTVDGSTKVTLQPGERHSQVMDSSYLAVNGTTDKAITVHSDTYLHVLLQYRTSSTSFYDTAQIQHIDSAQGHYKYYLVSNPATKSFGSFDQIYTLSTLSDANIEIYRNGNLLTSFILQPGRLYNFVEVQTPDFDITGTVVQSDKPLSVVCGSIESNNPPLESRFSTFITDVSQPPSRYFVAPHLGNRDDTGYDIRVIATVDDTTVTVDGEDHQLDEGEFVVIDYAGRTSVSLIGCSEDCNAYSILKSENSFWIGSLFSLVPTSQLYRSAFFITPEYNDADNHFVSLVLEGDDTESVTLDGRSLEGESWEHVEGFSYVWFQIEGGEHWLESSGGRFAAYVYGRKSSSTIYGYGHSILPGNAW